LPTSQSKASVCLSRAISSNAANARLMVPMRVLLADTKYFTARNFGKRRGWS